MIQVVCTHEKYFDQAKHFAKVLNGETLVSLNTEDIDQRQLLKSITEAVSVCERATFQGNEHQSYVVFAQSGHYVSLGGGKKALKVKVDFVSGAKAHRRQYGGGRKQALPKAVGVQAKFKPSILDCTAGQGGDAFVLADLGCRVEMLERSPIAHLLLDDALLRGREWAKQEGDETLLQVFNGMYLRAEDAHGYLANTTHKYDVVYLDPMFPERKKSALIKKEMRVFHELVGRDDDADELLAAAQHIATYRVVVKRPKIAPFLAGLAPSYQLLGKSTRFDIYTNKAFPTG